MDAPDLLDKNRKEAAMEIDFYFRFKLKPKNKKVILAVEDEN